MSMLDEIDLTDLDRFVDGFPHEWFTYLRREHPVWLHPGTDHGADGEPFWVVSSYEHVTEVHRSGTLFSHQTGPGRDGAGGIALNDIEAGRGPGLQMVMTDPPQHTRYRKLVNSGFTPRMVRRLTDTLRLRTASILDRVCERGECDFVTEVAADLPLMAIADIIGVPQDDRDKLFDWSNRTIGGSDPEYADDAVDPEHGDTYEGAMIEMAMYAHALADQKRSEPADDLWTRLVTAEVTMDDGTTYELTELEQDLFFTLLVVAGNETTRNAISHGLLAFFEHPDQWQRLREDRTLLETATEEILRWASPVNFFRRTATDDVELGGQQIKAGEKVSLWYPSANRDEAEFDKPFRFDVGRDPNHHVAFGAGGAHFCLGASLARLEIEIIFDELADRMPDISPAGDPQGLRMNLIQGVKHLPVTFTPSEPVGA
ncbi:MAG: cytochrome P450 [Acidimicrobiia bacterium]|nr:cytochrome P450 [Acidimicrobiia bacterium]